MQPRDQATITTVTLGDIVGKAGTPSDMATRYSRWQQREHSWGVWYYREDLSAIDSKNTI